MSKAIIVHEIEAKGFWVEAVEKSMFFGRSTKFLASDGSLEEHSLLWPARVIELGLFKSQAAAVLAANQYANIAARAEGIWSIPVKTSVSAARAKEGV